MKIMKRLFVAFVLVLSASLVLCSTAYADDDALFSDNFDGSKESEYSFYWGDWTFAGEEGGLSATTDDSSRDWPKAIVGQDKGWMDYVIDVDLEGVAEGGIVFRSTNAYEGPDGFNGYFIGYDSAYMFAGKDVNGWFLLPDDGPYAPAAAKLFYRNEMHWRIVVQGNTFTAYVDDMEHPLVCVQDNTYAEGGVGLRFHVFKGDESGCFKNLTVRPLSALGDELPGSGSTSTSPQASAPQPEPTPAPEKAPVAEEREPIAAETEETPAQQSNNNLVWIILGVAGAAALCVIFYAVGVKKGSRSGKSNET